MYTQKKYFTPNCIDFLFLCKNKFKTDFYLISKNSNTEFCLKTISDKQSGSIFYIETNRKIWIQIKQPLDIFWCEQNYVHLYYLSMLG